MRKLFLGLFALAVALAACENDQASLNPNENQEIAVDMSDFYVYTSEDDLASKGNFGKNCHTMKVLNRQLKENPSLEKRMFDIEKQVRTFIAAKKGKGNGNGGGNNGGGEDPPVDDNLGTITIPVVVHVLYNTPEQNISDQQINSQIAVLNKDFSATNNDLNNVPGEFAGVVADIDIQFVLDRVIRKQTSRSSFGTNDAIKYDSQGGSNAVDTSKYLNIWVGNIGGGVLGYAQFPGGNSATDGVVISPQYFGTTGYVAAPFDKGRTTTHEIGHWLNLRHIWGDGRCNRDDFVADTPRSDRPNYGCPTYPTVHCRSTDMTMNYMDYSDDACMYMFTQGQKERMRALFTAGGVRESFVTP